MKSAPAIAFDYRPSRSVAAAIVTIASLAIVAVVLSGIDPWIRLAVGFAACGYATLALWRFLASPVRRVAWHEAGHWRVVQADGQDRVAELRQAVVRGAWITLILRLTDGKDVALVLAFDNSDAELRRCLRVRLTRTAPDT